MPLKVAGEEALGVGKNVLGNVGLATCVGLYRGPMKIASYTN